MLSAAIAYQVLRQQDPQSIDKVKAVLEKHPWYANQWQTRLQDVPAAERDLLLGVVRACAVASRWRCMLIHENGFLVGSLESTVLE